MLIMNVVFVVGLVVVGGVVCFVWSGLLFFWPFGGGFGHKWPQTA